jgi:hypothetical protein
MALLGAGSAAIHQLRYAIGYGDAAPHALDAHGHAYLAVALPGIVAALLIALAAFGMRMAAGTRTSESRRLGFGALWLACAFALAAVYGVQETIEGAGAIAGGGWIGLALAIPAGLLVALGLRGASAAEQIEFAALRLPIVIRRAESCISSVVEVASRLPVHADGARAPPLTSVV